MTIKRKMVLPLALALGALGLMVVSQVASATHPRPKGATPLRASLVPAYKACAAPNRTHGAPLAFPSCNPPVQASNFLTVGTPDANGAAAANSVGFIRAGGQGQPGSARDDVLITSSISRRALQAARLRRLSVPPPTPRTVRTTRASCRATRSSGSPTTTTVQA